MTLSPPHLEPFLLRKWRGWLLATFFVGVSGCAAVPSNDLTDIVMPSNYRDWSPEFSVVPTVEIMGDEVTVRNVRNSSYVTESDYVLDFEDRNYKLSDLQTVDFICVPFAKVPMIAHTMLSFGFKGGDYLAISSEIRTERGETYSPLLGISRQYELTYVAADERDLIRLRTKHRNADVYLYRTLASPELSKRLFLSISQRMNELAETPEFYNTVQNNCTTNLVRHVNEIAPNRVPYSLGVLLPGYADEYAYDLGILDQSLPFPLLKQRSWINDLASRYFDDPEFSQKIRLRVATPDWDLQPVATESDKATTISSPSDKISDPPESIRRDAWVKRTSFPSQRRTNRRPDVETANRHPKRPAAVPPRKFDSKTERPSSLRWLPFESWSKRYR